MADQSNVRTGARSSGWPRARSPCRTRSRSRCRCSHRAWRCSSTSPAWPPQAGGSTPLAFLLGGIACLALAFVVIGFTRRMASAGYAYTYASRSLGKSAGFMAGWLYAFGLACFVPMTMAGVAYLFADLVGLGKSWWFPLFLHRHGAARGAVDRPDQGHHPAAAARRRRSPSLLIVIVNIVVTAKGGAHGNSGGPVHVLAHASRAASTASSTASSWASRPTSASRPPPTSARRRRTRAAPSRSRSSPRRCSRSCSTCWTTYSHVHRRRRRPHRVLRLGRQHPRSRRSPTGTSPAGSAR